MLKQMIFYAFLVLAPVAVAFSGQVGQAETQVSQASVTTLVEALKMPETLAVMVEEGKAYGASIEAQMFPGEGGARWERSVTEIYEVSALHDRFVAAFADAIGADTEAMAGATAFFSSDLGQEILKLEIAGREALLDEAVEDAARVDAERMQSERSPKLGLIRDLVEAGNLIEKNVAGALGANLAFLEGMGSVDAPGMAMDEEQLMTEVWSQEEVVRDETQKWLYPYLALAYQPLSESDLEAYVAFGQSDAGKKLNAALFLAYDKVFREVSFQLGQAAAQHLKGRDI